MKKCRLYLITPPEFEIQAFLPQLRNAFEGGDVACLQLRMKDENEIAPDDNVIENAAEAILPICREFDVQFIINDRPALAKKIGADGVHIGGNDGSVADARKIVGDEMIVGCSCYDSRHRAMEAGEQDADYVAFGAFYPTKTKAVIRHPEIEILETWSEFSNLPSVAIGGITPANLTPLVKAGANFIAVVTGIWNNPKGAKTAVGEYNKAIADSF